MKASAAFYIALALCVGHALSIANLVRLTDERAKCMDGTLSGYYIEESTANPDKFIIHLQGGGECASKAACAAQINTPLGSSKKFSPQMNLGFLNSNSCKDNPDFCQWTHVSIPYCTQDLHSGLRTQATPDTFGYYFSGAHVFNAVINALESSHGLGRASHIVLSGDSAGGIGTWLHLDALAARFSSALVVGAPIAGFYFYAYPYAGPNHTQSVLVDFSPESWPHLITLWNSTSDASCLESLRDTPWACMLANYSFPYISSAAFITESLSDYVVLLYHDDIPVSYVRQPPELAYVQSWTHNMTQGLGQPLGSTRYGVFAPACFIHTEFNASSPLIGGRNFLQVLGDWLFGRSSAIHAIDNCGIFCNPSCYQPPAL